MSPLLPRDFFKTPPPNWSWVWDCVGALAFVLFIIVGSLI